MKWILTYLVASICLVAYADIPNHAVTFGAESKYLYGQFTYDVDLPRDSMYCGYFEYGVHDNVGLIVQHVWSSDVGVNVSGLGVAYSIFDEEYLNLVGVVTYNFDFKDDHLCDNMQYSIIGSGKIWNNFGWMGTVSLNDYTWNDDVNSDFFGRGYLTYNIDNVLIYIMYKNRLNRFDCDDVSIGSIISICEKCNLFFDVGNLSNHHESMYISIGLDWIF